MGAGPTNKRRLLVCAINTPSVTDEFNMLYFCPFHLRISPAGLVLASQHAVAMSRATGFTCRWSKWHTAFISAKISSFWFTPRFSPSWRGTAHRCSVVQFNACCQCQLMQDGSVPIHDVSACFGRRQSAMPSHARLASPAAHLQGAAPLDGLHARCWQRG